MLCSAPILVGKIGSRNMVVCGQCIACRINRRDEWTTRCILEAQSHRFNTYFTLTYADEHLPSDGKISKPDIQKFMQNLRNSYRRSKYLRYFIAGEYGTKTKRPHYHGIIFGAFVDELIKTCWNKGHVKAEELRGDAGVRYVCKYITKGSKDHETFAMMSRKPGIGYSAIQLIAAEFRNHQRPSDDLKSIQIGGKKWPVDRYTREKIKQLLGERSVPQLGRSWANDLKAEWHIQKGDPKAEAREKDYHRAKRKMSDQEQKETL